MTTQPQTISPVDQSGCETVPMQGGARQADPSCDSVEDEAEFKRILEGLEPHQINWLVQQAAAAKLLPAWLHQPETLDGLFLRWQRELARDITDDADLEAKCLSCCRFRGQHVKLA